MRGCCWGRNNNHDVMILDRSGNCTSNDLCGATVKLAACPRKCVVLGKSFLADPTRVTGIMHGLQVAEVSSDLLMVSKSVVMDGCRVQMGTLVARAPLLVP